MHTVSTILNTSDTYFKKKLSNSDQNVRWNFLWPDLVQPEKFKPTLPDKGNAYMSTYITIRKKFIETSIDKNVDVIKTKIADKVTWKWSKRSLKKISWGWRMFWRLRILKWKSLTIILKVWGMRKFANSFVANVKRFESEGWIKHTWKNTYNRRCPFC